MRRAAPAAGQRRDNERGQDCLESLERRDILKLVFVQGSLRGQIFITPFNAGCNYDLLL